MLVNNLENLSSQRVLTMSNNRRCDYLVVDVGRESTIVMGIIEGIKTKDIVLIKEIKINKDFNNLVREVKNICYEFDIHTILIDKCGFGMSFYDAFNKKTLDSDNIETKFIIGITPDIRNNIILKFKYDIENSNIRFLQTYLNALNSYRKGFLGYSDIMNFHRETDLLIEEIENVELFLTPQKIIKLQNNKNETNSFRIFCLLIYYAYKDKLEQDKIEDEKETKIAVSRLEIQYGIGRGIFYKYMLKAVDNSNINIIFYYNEYGKIGRFKGMTEEIKFKELFNNEIKNIKKNNQEFVIEFLNGSIIQFIYASDSTRGYEYHYAVVDTGIDKKTYEKIIRPKDIYDMDKEKKNLKDNYNIEFLEM